MPHRIELSNQLNNLAMSKVLIIGAGGVGTVVAHKVAASPVFTEIMLASRTKSKADDIAAAVGGGRIKRPGWMPTASRS